MNILNSLSLLMMLGILWEHRGEERHLFLFGESEKTLFNFLKLIKNIVNPMFNFLKTL